MKIIMMMMMTAFMLNLPFTKNADQMLTIKFTIETALCVR